MNKLIIFIVSFLSLSVYGQANNSIRETFKEKTKIENPFDLRDPFKPPILSSTRKLGRGTVSLLRDGVYTNINPLGQVDLDTLQIVGVMIGKERIHPGGIIMVEKLVNVYGEEEYLETVIPISQ